MSETLSSQDRRALKEMPLTPEMGELRKITTLQDIPLAEGDNSMHQRDFQQIENERKLKTNSLKRLFRLPTKKKTEEGCLEGAISHMAVEEAKPATVVDNANDITASFSKANLKSSLSSYWNSVFKLKKYKKSSKSQMELEQAATSTAEMENSGTNSTKDLSANYVAGTNDCIAPDSNILEEIHNLKISKETK